MIRVRGLYRAPRLMLCLHNPRAGTRNAPGWAAVGLSRRNHEADQVWGSDFLLVMDGVLLFLRSVLRKETKLMYKRITDSWILCQETSSSVVEVYLLRDSLSCCNKRDPKHNGLVKMKSYLFSLNNPEKSSQITRAALPSSTCNFPLWVQTDYLAPAVQYVCLLVSGEGEGAR